MFRLTSVRLCASKEIQKQKMGTLLKIVMGETQFKNKAPVKDCNLAEVFGSNWKSELTQWYNQDYTAKMDKADKEGAVLRLQKYLNRLELTRYTAKELATFMSGGAHSVAAYAEADQVAKGAEFLKANGEGAFMDHIKAEGKNGNWTDAQVADFAKKVKSA